MISITNLYKYYNGKTILNNINLEIKKGDIIGILGPNGAGKTTLLETVEGLRTIDKGEVYVMGYNMKKNHKNGQVHFGIQLQKNSLIEDLTVKETIDLFKTLYDGIEDTNQLLLKLDLDKCKKTTVKHLSGGQFQRLKLCLAILNKPQIIFLDEPTTGLDPNARLSIWKIIKELAKESLTILTTHYMEEAEYLCNRVIILDAGRIIADDSPVSLINSLSIEHIITLDRSDEILKIPVINELKTKLTESTIYIYVNNLPSALFNILSEAEKNNVTIKNIKIHQANLEDVFLLLTQKELYHETNIRIN
ncbi:MAG: ABC transporter ATP-binding protein [Dysgonamonadaceae bacterium]|jgi:ABC-2 type transport system ATP-binding protein|nr:ABC transporter ATP-binding protein [Dysgonamonadaceae bacterium]